MNTIHTVANICVWIALGMNGYMMWRNHNLLKQLRRDTRLASAYRQYWEDRAREDGINYPFPTPEELEGEEA